MITIEFYSAPWCPACQTIKPDVKAYNNNNPRIRIIEKDIEANQIFKQEFDRLGFDSLPLMIVREGQKNILNNYRGTVPIRRALTDGSLSKLGLPTTTVDPPPVKTPTPQNNLLIYGGIGILAYFLINRR